MLLGETVKIIDFGKSHKLNSKHEEGEVRESPYYIAPELIDGEESEKCDIWSCGVITFLLLSGSPPFNGLDEEHIFK